MPDTADRCPDERISRDQARRSHERRIVLTKCNEMVSADRHGPARLMRAMAAGENRVFSVSDMETGSERIRQAVAEITAGPVEAGDGIAQPVANGDELGQGAVLVFVVVLVFVGGVVVVGHALSDAVSRFSRVRR